MPAGRAPGTKPYRVTPDSRSRESLAACGGICKARDGPPWNRRRPAGPYLYSARLPAGGRSAKPSNHTWFPLIGSGDSFIHSQVPFVRTGERTNRKPLAFNRSPQILLGTPVRLLRSAHPFIRSAV